MTKHKLIEYLKHRGFKFNNNTIKYPNVSLQEYKVIMGADLQQVEAAVDKLVIEHDFDYDGIKA